MLQKSMVWRRLIFIKGEGDLFLIYPATENFLKPIEGFFQLSDTLRLYVVPFQIDNGGKSGLLYDFKTE